MRRMPWLLVVLPMLMGMSATAQKGKVPPPKRPPLDAGADTNNATNYYQWGVARLARSPDDAASAFYWATRINPSWADAYYARWVAMHLSDPRRFVYYMEGDKRTHRSAEVRQIDSLYLRALNLNPFLYRKFQQIMLHEYLVKVYGNSPSADYMVRDAWSKGIGSTGAEQADMRGWAAYSIGNFPRALEEFATAALGVKDKSFVHAERGRIFYLMGAYDSATAQLMLAVKQWRKEDKDELVFVYESKALYEYSLGMIQAEEKHADSAREAYGRALLEDLSFAPAHLRLSDIDLATGDTAGALSEMEIAAQVQPGDGVIAFLYGYRLLQSGKVAEALKELQRAVALEPYYSAPYMLMARMYDASEMKDDAAAEYSHFVQVASQTDPQIAHAKQRLKALSSDTATAATAATPPNP